MSSVSIGDIGEGWGGGGVHPLAPSSLNTL